MKACAVSAPRGPVALSVSVLHQGLTGIVWCQGWIESLGFLPFFE